MNKYSNYEIYSFVSIGYRSSLHLLLLIKYLSVFPTENKGDKVN